MFFKWEDSEMLFILILDPRFCVDNTNESLVTEHILVEVGKFANVIIQAKITLSLSSTFSC